MNGTIALLSGLLSFFSPCILPLVPSYLVFISGVTINSFHTNELKRHRKTVIVHSLAFILGFAVVFILLGLTTSIIGTFLILHQIYFLRIGGLLLIIVGLHSLHLFRIPILDREMAFHLQGKPAGLIGSFIVGATFSIGWSPCVGPALSSILLLAGTSGKIGQGTYLLSLYSLGLAVPFFLSALLFDRVFVLIGKFNTALRYTTKVLGILLVILGILLFTNTYGEISLAVTRLLSF